MSCGVIVDNSASDVGEISLLWIFPEVIHRKRLVIHRKRGSYPQVDFWSRWRFYSFFDDSVDNSLIDESEMRANSLFCTLYINNKQFFIPLLNTTKYKKRRLWINGYGNLSRL